MFLNMGKLLIMASCRQEECDFSLEVLREHVLQNVCLDDAATAHSSTAEHLAATMLNGLQQLPPLGPAGVASLTKVAQLVGCNGGGSFSVNVCHRQASKSLQQLILAGYLTSFQGDLIFKDRTGEIHCQVLHPVPLGAVDSYVLLIAWNYIHVQSTCLPSQLQSYLEISKYQVLYKEPVPIPECVCTEPPAYLSISQVISHIRSKQKPKQKLLDVYGIVDGVSDLLRNGPSRLFLIRLKDVSTRDSYIVTVMLPQFLHLVHCLELEQLCRLTALRDVVMNKGKARMLAFSSATQVELQQSPYPLSKAGGEAERSAELRQVSQSVSEGAHSSVLGSPSLRAVTRAEGSKPVCYTGAITSSLLPDAGVYELDDAVRLYLIYMDTACYGLGLRPGATVQLQNVRILRPPHPNWKALGGFYCCPAESRVSIMEYSKDLTCDKPFSTRKNKLVSILRRLAPVDMSWAAHAFLSLQQNLKETVGAPQRMKVFDLLRQLADLQDLQWETTSCFLAHPTHCPLSVTPSLDRRRIYFPSVASLLQNIQERIAPFEAGQCCHPQGSRHRSLSQSTPQWSYVMKDGDKLFSCKPVLVGVLSGSGSAGCLQLGDSTGNVLIADCSNRYTGRGGGGGGREEDGVSAQMGNILIVEEFTVVVEQVLLPRQQGSTVTELLIPYLCPLKWRSMPRGARVELLANVVKARNCLFFTVLCKNSLVRDASAHSSSHWYCDTVVLAHSNIEELAAAIARGSEVKPTTSSQDQVCKYILHFTGASISWCPLLHYGCLYCLTTLREGVGLPQPRRCSITITSDHSIELMESSPRWRAGPPLLDVVHLIEKTPLPSFSVVCRQSSPGSAMCDISQSSGFTSELVSFTGIVLCRSFRIDQSPSAQPAPSFASLPPPSSSANSSSLTPHSTPSSSLFSPYLSSYITAVQVQSTTHPDTIMVYFSLRQFPIQLGLLPGAEVAFHKFQLVRTNLGNPYAKYCSSSSVELVSLSISPTGNGGVGREDHNSLPVMREPSPEMLNLPVTPLISLINALLRGELSRRVVAVRAEVVSVQQVSLQLVCQSCGAVVVGGSCAAHCLIRSHLLKQEARLLIDDGSGEAHVYLERDQVAAALACLPGEWNSLTRQAESLGSVFYSRYTHTSSCKTGKAFYSYLPPAAAKVHSLLAEVVNRPSVHRKLMIYSSPFVSSSELKESIIGQKAYAVRIGSVSYTTLALPRLQLRAMAFQVANSLQEARKMKPLLTKN